MTLLGKSDVLVDNLDVPIEDIKTITADRVVFDRQEIAYFRSAALTAAERMLGKGVGAMVCANPDSRNERDFLRPLFKSAAWTTILEMIGELRTADLPFPEDYLVMMPRPDSKNPSRDDVIRALVPFEKAQREALRAGWQDQTVAIRITHERPAGLHV